jgi:hypothetical protein
METSAMKCISCDRGENEAPLIAFHYQGGQYWICAQHLPILIHRPALLAGQLPGLEKLGPAEEHPHH